MLRYRLLELALADLDHICRYTLERWPNQVDELIDRIFGGINTIATFPESGERVDQLCAGMRRFSEPPYVIYFQREGDFIEVLRILHGAQDAESQKF